MSQISHLVANLGDNLIVVAFFVCLLHTFRRPAVNALRWAVLTMWGAAVVGMALLGGGDPADAVGANQLGVLFLPVMLGFGLAFVLVLFSRREGGSTAAGRILLFSVLILVSAVPLILHAVAAQRPAVPVSAVPRTGHQQAQGWTRNDEIIGSDMPWAVAWYADRKSVWIPDHVPGFHGAERLRAAAGPLAGLFMTTFTRNEPFYSGIYKGEYQEWQPLIFGRTDMPGFPFKEGTLLLGDLSYTFYSDSKRWEQAGPRKTIEERQEGRRQGRRRLHLVFPALAALVLKLRSSPDRAPVKLTAFLPSAFPSAFCLSPRACAFAKPRQYGPSDPTRFAFMPRPRTRRPPAVPRGRRSRARWNGSNTSSRRWKTPSCRWRTSSAATRKARSSCRCAPNASAPPSSASK